MRRVRGLETEYGLSIRVPTPSGTWRRMGSDEAAHLLFAPVVEQYRATNAYLRNGGRLYLDVGSHPEYATAECSTISELVAQDRAGDLVLARLAARCREALEAEGTQARISVFKNNVDSHGNAYGSHENYQVSRALDLEALVESMTSFLVTRQLLCGAGHWERDRLGRGRFLVSQRAAHMSEGLSSSTTRSRPMVNTRDEPHADADRFRRMHVIVGDSNLVETTTLVRLGSTELVLRALEAGLSVPHVVDDPARAIREVAADVTGRAAVTAAGDSALAVQWAWWHLTEPFVDDAELAAAHALWAEVLTALDDGAPERVADRIDWIAKQRLMLAQAERHGMAVDDPRLAAVDLAWHDVVAGQGLERAAERRGQVARWLADGVAERAEHEPPATTRAVLRSRFLVEAQRHQRSYGVDWMTFTCHDLDGGQVAVTDPLATLDARVDELVARMAVEPRTPAAQGLAGLPDRHRTLG